MNSQLVIATDSGLVLAVANGDNARIKSIVLERQNLTCVAAGNGVLLAGSTNGIYRSLDNGQSWQESDAGVTVRHARWLAFHPESDGLVCLGTEPAALFVSHDSGATWSGRPEVTDLRDELGWFLPYSPESGCVRGFAALGQQLYAAVEVGGMLASADGGEDWQLVPGSDGVPRFGQPGEGMIHPDVHSVEVHPSSSDLVYAPTGGGFYYSKDGGRHWEARHPPCYCRAVWVDPDDPGHIILGPADSVDRNGRIAETDDGGQNWRPADDGVDTPWPRTMVERFTQVGDKLIALLSDGRILTADLPALRWRPLLPEITDARCIDAFG